MARWQLRAMKANEFKLDKTKKSQGQQQYIETRRPDITYTVLGMDTEGTRIPWMRRKEGMTLEVKCLYLLCRRTAYTNIIPGMLKLLLLLKPGTWYHIVPGTYS